MWLSVVRIMNTNGKLTVISLFAGCGGSSLGYKMAGFKELLAIDFDENAVKTFKLNFPEVPIWLKDITQIKGKDMLEFCNIKEGELDVLDGSPPCQGFSIAGKRKVYDKRNDLVLEYIRLVNELQPKVFVMENVSGMVQGTMKGLFKEYMLKMKALNYMVKCKLMNAKYYNVPQSRKRLIWVGVRKDLEKEEVFPKGNKKLITVKAAIFDLEEEEENKDTNHEWIPVLEKHKVYPFMKKAKQGEKLGFGLSKRLNYSLPSPTIQTSGVAGPYIGSSWFCHPTLDRPISIREALRLQSFSDSFLVIGTLKDKAHVIGNSVPPLFMYAIAKTVKEEILKSI